MRLRAHTPVWSFLNLTALNGGTVPISPLDPSAGAASGASVVARPAAAPRRDFAAALESQLAEPREQMGELRAAIAAIRSGRVFSASTGSLEIGQRLATWAAHGTGAADPYGWRALTRDIGERTIPGFGAVFERQIAQESGFDPAVALGERRSSAGAEGIAQLMPQYYSAVDRTDPQASLTAAAGTMRHYLDAFDGDVRKALASYNLGMGRVQQLVQAHGAAWERALPEETRRYLASIVGDAHSTLRTGGAAAVFGGRGPGGVLSAPLDGTRATQRSGSLLGLLGTMGAAVRAPADAVLTAIQPGTMGSVLTLDHGNGWRSTLDGVTNVMAPVGEYVTRGTPLGVLAGDSSDAGDGAQADATLRLGLSLQGRALDPMLYMLPR